MNLLKADDATLGDPILTDALTAALATNELEALKALAKLKAPADRAAKLGPIAARVAEHFARGKRGDDLAGILEGIETGSFAGPIADGLAKGWPRDVAMPAKADAALSAALSKATPEAQSR
ncbi:MAG TPA: hypothetical protein VNC50_20270, partial [Planctomycetia bacterium]|nr:hypothetical protein [Planctomycetia bacterium]